MFRMDDNFDLLLIKVIVLEVLRFGNIVEIVIFYYILKDILFGKYCVFKDIVVIINLQCVYLDLDCWENLNMFNFYRYIDLGGNFIINLGNFLFFLVGRRVCVGEVLVKVSIIRMFLYSL